MLFWLIAIAVTAIACAALFYAAGPRTVNAGAAQSADANSHFRALLAGIDADLAQGRLGEPEAVAAKAELAREIIRQKSEHVPSGKRSEIGNGTLLAGLALVAMLALGLYFWLGRPELESQPLAGRPEVAAQSMDLPTAIARIEAALEANPNDSRGWTAIGTAYMLLGRYADAVRAYRQVLALNGPDPDIQVNLAEALLREADGAASPEALTLLEAASAADPDNAMARLYRASELTRLGRFEEAIPVWQSAIALAKGDEPWLAAARQGLAVAQNGGEAPTDPQQSEMIQQMVSGLADRLADQGGSVEEWAQLVRAYLVLEDKQKAQAAYDEAVKAYPQAFDRGELDTLALGAGLTLNGGEP